MMDWDYRVFCEENGDYVIREVFYDKAGSILGCTRDAVEPSGRSLDELAKDIEGFREAIALPVLTLADFPHATARTRQRDRSKNLSHEQLSARLGFSKAAANRRRSRRATTKKHVLAADGKKRG